MRIDSTMDLGHLAERMGDAADRNDAIAMRDLLTETEYADTVDVPETEWLVMLDRAVATARANEEMKMTKVITYSSSRGEYLDLTEAQVEMLERAGKWPRDQYGEEYCDVSHGLHEGYPDMTDAELRADVGLSDQDR